MICEFGKVRDSDGKVRDSDKDNYLVHKEFFQTINSDRRFNGSHNYTWEYSQGELEQVEQRNADEDFAGRQGLIRYCCVNSKGYERHEEGGTGPCETM